MISTDKTISFPLTIVSPFITHGAVILTCSRIYSFELLENNVILKLCKNIILGVGFISRGYFIIKSSLYFKRYNFNVFSDVKK
jgi:hypothetical protein